MRELLYVFTFCNLLFFSPSSSAEKIIIIGAGFAGEKPELFASRATKAFQITYNKLARRKIY